MDEFEIYGLLIVLAVFVIGWILYQLYIGATYALTVIFGVLYIIVAMVGAVLLAGLDMLFCPPKLALAPWIAWAVWGAVTGGLLGFWTVAPVYGLRRARRLIAYLPLGLAVLVMGLRLSVAPSPLLAAKPQAPPPPGPAQVIGKPQTVELPLVFCNSVAASADTQRDLVFNFSGRDYQLPLDAWRHPSGGVSLPLPSIMAATGTQRINMAVIVEPRIAAGGANDTTLWKTSRQDSGGFVAQVQGDDERVYFTVVIAPDGKHRFVDGAALGTDGPGPGQRSYDISTASGLRNMGRTHSRIVAGYRFEQLVADNSGWVADGQGSFWPRYEFPQGVLTVTISALGS